MQQVDPISGGGALYQQLALWREILEGAWCRSTAYRKTDPASFSKARSAGQCAVTAILLINRLPALKALNPRIALGRVTDAQSDNIAIGYHGWIEVGSIDSPTIVDLTADQAQCCDQKVVLTSYESSGQVGLIYERARYLERDEAREKDVWLRYLRLSKRLAKNPIGAMPVPGIHTALDLTGITDNDVARYLGELLETASAPQEIAILSAALRCAREYSFSDTRTYPRPDHPDPAKRRSPIFTLVAVVASLRTTLEIEQKVVHRILERYPTDKDLFEAKESDLASLLTPSGMAATKARTICRTIAYLSDNHGGEWDYFQSAPLEDARNALLSVEGLGPKAVDCLLTVGLGRPSVAVDVNVFRVVSRLFDFEWSENPNYSDTRQVARVKNILQSVVRDDAFLAQILHTLFLLHGKHTCRAKCAMETSILQEQCGVCVRKYNDRPWQKGLF